MRCWLLLLLVALLPAADLASDAAQVRTETEASLARTRATLQGEREAMAGKLQQAAAATQQARAERHAAETALAQAQSGAAARALAAERETRELEQLAALVEQPPADTRQEQTVIGRDGRSAQVTVTQTGPRCVALGSGPLRGSLRDGRVQGSTPPPMSAPLDITGRLAEARDGSGGLSGWLAAGRIFIWPILGVGLLGLLVAVRRLRALLAARPDRVLAGAVISLARDRRLAEARERLAAASGDLAEVLRGGIDRLADPRPAREAAVDAALLAAEPRLTRGTGLLLMLAGIAPLLGLLGTVTGMIDLFAVIGAQGTGNARNLSGGISEALVTTQAGMLVAVPLMICHALLARIAERQRLVLEEAGAAVLGVEP